MIDFIAEDDAAGAENELLVEDEAAAAGDELVVEDEAAVAAGELVVEDEAAAARDELVVEDEAAVAGDELVVEDEEVAAKSIGTGWGCSTSGVEQAFSGIRALTNSKGNMNEVSLRDVFFFLAPKI